MNRNSYPNGLTVKELKEYLKNIPDVDSSGEPTLVWLQSGIGYTSPAVFITPLDKFDIALYYNDK